MTPPNCDHREVDGFLERMTKPGADDATVQEHLDNCPECRSYFLSQVATQEFWDEAADLLQPSEFDEAGRAEFSAGSMGTVSVGSLQIRDVLARLAPTDDAESLGRIGTYEVTGVVGAGSMGVVLKGFDSALDRVVAIKTLAPHLASSGTARRRFEREAKAVAAILHPNVIPIHGVSGDGDLPYFVMSYIRGESLQKRLNNHGPLPVDEVLRIGHQIASGLSAAHSRGLVHRDIKPANILLEGETERVTITDFGLARAVDDVSLTHAGVIAGTPQYMSPEQSNAQTVDQRSDLFSLGSVLYALCTGRPPFRSQTSYGLIREINESEPTPIRELNPAIPNWLCNLIAKLLAKDKSERFAKADEVCQLLESCLKHIEQPMLVPVPDELLSDGQPTLSRQVFHPQSFFKALAMVLSFCAAIYLLQLPLSDNQTPSVEDSRPTRDRSVQENVDKEGPQKQAVTKVTVPVRHVVELELHKKPIHTIQWSVDGKRLAIVSEDGLVSVWEATGKFISQTSITMVDHPIVSFSADLSRVAIVRSKDSLRLLPKVRNGGEAVIYSLPDGKQANRLNARAQALKDSPFQAMIAAVALSPDGKKLAVGGSLETAEPKHGGPGGMATIWDVETAEIVRGEKLSTPATAFAWTDNGKVLLIGTGGSGTESAEAGEIHAWHEHRWLPVSGRPTRVFHRQFLSPLPVGKPGYAERVGVRQLRVVGDRLTALINDGTNKERVTSWDLMTGKSDSATMELDWRRGLTLELSRNGTLLAAHKAEFVTLYDAQSLKEITPFKGPASVRAVGFNPNDTKIAVGTKSGSVQIHKITH